MSVSDGIDSVSILIGRKFQVGRCRIWGLKEERVGPPGGEDAQNRSWAQQTSQSAMRVDQRKPGTVLSLGGVWPPNCSVCSFHLGYMARGRALTKLGSEFPNLKNEEADKIYL